MIPSKKKKVHQRVHHYTLSTTNRRMAHFDVFNGDADGICALQKLRLTALRETTLITGVKRDIALLARVRANPGDEVRVLDISPGQESGCPPRAAGTRGSGPLFRSPFSGGHP